MWQSVLQCMPVWFGVSAFMMAFLRTWSPSPRFADSWSRNYNPSPRSSLRSSNWVRDRLSLQSSDRERDWLSLRTSNWEQDRFSDQVTESKINTSIEWSRVRWILWSSDRERDRFSNRVTKSEIDSAIEWPIARSCPLWHSIDTYIACTLLQNTSTYCVVSHGISHTTKSHTV